MALPFPLVSGSSYFILSIYYYLLLSSLHLHHHQAQGASSTATVEPSFRFRMKVKVATMPFELCHQRCATEPSCQHPLSSQARGFYFLLLHPYKNPRRVWDPGIEVSSFRVKVATMALPFDLALGINGGSYFIMPHPLFGRAHGDLQALFHYSHPVLSRPTVPNIQ